MTKSSERRERRHRRQMKKGVSAPPERRTRITSCNPNQENCSPNEDEAQAIHKWNQGKLQQYLRRLDEDNNRCEPRGTNRS